MSTPGNKKRQDNIGISEAIEIADLVKTSHRNDASVPVWGNSFWVNLAGVGELSKSRSWQTLKNFARSVSNGKSRNYDWDNLFDGVPRQGEANSTDEFKRVRRTQLKKKWDPLSVRELADYILHIDDWDFENEDFWIGIQGSMVGSIYTTDEIRELLSVFDPQLFLDQQVPAETVSKLNERFIQADLSILSESFDDEMKSNKKLDETDVLKSPVISIADGASKCTKAKELVQPSSGRKGLSAKSIVKICNDVDLAAENIHNDVSVESQKVSLVKVSLQNEIENQKLRDLYRSPGNMEVGSDEKSLTEEEIQKTMNSKAVAEEKPSTVKRKRAEGTPEGSKEKIRKQTAGNSDQMASPLRVSSVIKTTKNEPVAQNCAEDSDQHNQRKALKIEKRKTKGSDMFALAWDALSSLENSSAPLCREMLADMKKIVQSLKPLYRTSSPLEEEQVNKMNEKDFLQKLGQWQICDQDPQNHNLATAFMKIFTLANRSVKMQMGYESVLKQLSELKKKPKEI